MYFTPKQKEKHTFVFITDSISEISLEMGLFNHISKFNVPFPADAELISQQESPDRQYLKSIYARSVEFFKNEG